jgi:hypothetical protein
MQRIALIAGVSTTAYIIRAFIARGAMLNQHPDSM